MSATAAPRLRANWLRRITGSGHSTTGDGFLDRLRLPGAWIAAPKGTPAGTELPGRLVVGPGGAFWIHTVRRSGNLRVSAGSMARDVASARRDAQLLGQAMTARLGMPTLVQAVIAVDGATVQVIDQPEGVTIVAWSLLRAWLTGQPSVHRDAMAQRMAHALAR